MNVTEPAPVVSFTPTGATTGVSPVSVSFEDKSSNTPTSWNWTIQGYGTTNSTKYLNASYTQNAAFTFTTGNFSVVLGAGNSGGYTVGTQVSWVNVTEPAPVVSFTPTGATTGVSPVSVSFEDKSSNTPTSWNWTIQGYGTTNSTKYLNASYTQNAAFTFTTGNFSVVLGAGNSGGYTVGTQVSWVNVTEPAPVVSFTPTGATTGVSPVSVSFEDKSSNTPTSWNWTIQGYGTTNSTKYLNASYTQNAAFTFTTGNFSVVLGAGNSGGYTVGTQVSWVNVTEPAPVVSFTPTGATTGVSPVSVSFEDKSSNTPTSWNWTIQGYGTTNSTKYLNASYTQNAAFTFTTGNFSVVLGAGNSGGYTVGTQVSWVNVTEPAPVVSFTPTWRNDRRITGIRLV